MNLGNWQTFTDRHITTVRNMIGLGSVEKLIHASDLLAVATDAMCYAVQEAKTEKERGVLHAMLKDLRTEANHLQSLQTEALKKLSES